MEDFDFIDALAKSELSDKTSIPSENGWEIVQQKIKRKKRKRFAVYLLLLMLFGWLSVYTVGHFGENIEQNSMTHTKEKKIPSQNKMQHISKSASQEKININSKEKISIEKVKVSSIDNITRKTSVDVNSTTQINTSSLRSYDKNHSSEQQGVDFDMVKKEEEKTFILEDDEVFYMEKVGVKLYEFSLVVPETLQKKRAKQSKKTKKVIYENFDVMVGFNGFTSSNNYKFLQSYVVEVSYTEEKELKNNYIFNYGASVQYRNLHIKNDSISFNKGEVSLNLISSFEKRFGHFSIEAGSYVGYELYSPNNELLGYNTSNFFEQKINYGLFSGLHYKKVGLVFKYELSPYITYLGAKKFGAFTVGITYDF
ncbi:hypothetical protein [Kordia zhangzhouensis]|uniref:hypothetical protein n=1 Tax=Kordia zhangzhouensis TaxID=1620405 RepID=UPI000629BBE7|nr:hypothetical protein [Kordia zhangzhouensis]